MNAFLVGAWNGCRDVHNNFIFGDELERVWAAGIGGFETDMDERQCMAYTLGSRAAHDIIYAFSYYFFFVTISSSHRHIWQKVKVFYSVDNVGFFFVVNLTYTIFSFLFIRSSVSLFRLHRRHAGRVWVWVCVSMLKKSGIQRKQKKNVQLNINTPRGDGKQRMNEWMNESEPSQATDMYAKELIEKSCRTLCTQ